MFSYAELAILFFSILGEHCPVACFRFFFLVVVLGAACSCAQLDQTQQMVGLPIWQTPHRHDVRRIALLPFSGDEEFTTATQQHIAERLHEAGYFEMVSLEAGMRGAAGEGDANIIQKQLRLARKSGVDTLVGGQIKAGYGRTGIGNIAFGPPLHKAVITLKTIDVASGRVREHQQVMKEFRGEVEAHPDSGQSEVDLFKRLARDCADDLISEIFVSRTTVSVPLAIADRKAKHVWRGNLLAQQGRWADARQAWEKAVEDDPNCHAARYNLGLACEASQQFGEANDHYAAAIGIEDQEEYYVAVARCNLANQQYSLALQNLRGRFLANPSPVLPPIGGTLTDNLGAETASLLRRLPPVR